MLSPALQKKRRAKDAYLRRKFGISYAEYLQIFELQGYACAGCRRRREEFKNSFAVDHDHSTGAVRGLLCWHCNSLLPARHNLLAVLKNLIVYLETPPATVALGETRYVPKKKRKR